MAASLVVPVNPMARMWRSYERSLQRRPVMTQAVTSAVLWGAGDYLAQKVAGGRNAKLDLKRLALTSAFGGAVMGPTGHFWYNALDKACARLALLLGLKAGCAAFTVVKLMADNLFYVPMYLSLFLVYGATFMEGASPKQAKEKLRKEFMPTWAVEVMMWPPYMTFVFNTIPLKHQLLAVNLFSMVEVMTLACLREKGDVMGQLTDSFRMPNLWGKAVEVLQSIGPALDEDGSGAQLHYLLMQLQQQEQMLERGPRPRRSREVALAAY